MRLNNLDGILQRMNSKSPLKDLLFWCVPVVFMASAVLVAGADLRLPLLLTYISLMLFLMITKFRLDKAISDQSAIDQLREDLIAHRETTSVIAYLNSVAEPNIPIWYSRAFMGYSSSPEMLEELFNRIVAEKPKTILELGSGLSTLIASYAVKKNGYGRVASWDSLETRASGNREIINSHNQEIFSEIHHVQTREKPDNLDQFVWYDMEPETGLNFLIIDDSIEQPGVPEAKDAIRALKSHLEPGCTILLHDRIRPAAKDTIPFWLDNNEDLLLIHTIRTTTNTYSVLRFGLR